MEKARRGLLLKTPLQPSWRSHPGHEGRARRGPGLPPAAMSAATTRSPNGSERFSQRGRRRAIEDVAARSTLRGHRPNYLSPIKKLGTATRRSSGLAERQAGCKAPPACARQPRRIGLNGILVVAGAPTLIYRLPDTGNPGSRIDDLFAERCHTPIPDDSASQPGWPSQERRDLFRRWSLLFRLKSLGLGTRLENSAV